MNTPEDDAYEEDIATVQAALDAFRATLETAGLWTSKHGDEARVRVTAYSRIGAPVEMDSSRA